MTQHSIMLIHQPSVDIPQSKFAEIKDEAYNLELLFDAMLDIYVSHSKLEKNQVRNMILNERYLTATECLKYGFIDEIL